MRTDCTALFKIKLFLSFLLLLPIYRWCTPVCDYALEVSILGWQLGVNPDRWRRSVEGAPRQTPILPSEKSNPAGDNVKERGQE